MQFQNQYHMLHVNAIGQTHVTVETGFQEIWDFNTSNFVILSCKRQREKDNREREHAHPFQI